MCPEPISYSFLWWSFEQDGLATMIAGIGSFIAGLMAVIAATIVGLRQTAISNSQTKILEEQARIADGQRSLQALSVKRELLDDRLEVYDAAEAFIRYVIQTGTSPLTGNSKRAKEIRDEFGEQMERAKFLFRDGVSNDLDTIFQLASKLHFHDQMTDAPDADREHHIGRSTEIKSRFLVIRNELADIFGEEIRLGERSGRAGLLTKDGHQA